MTEPMVLAVVVALALAVIVATVTYMLFRTVRSGRKPSRHRMSRTPTPVELMLAKKKFECQETITRTDSMDGEGDLAKTGAEALIDIFRQSVQDDAADTAVRAAGAAAALGITDPDQVGEMEEYRRKHPQGADSHLWKPLDHDMVFRLVMSPSQDISIDALLSLLAPHTAVVRSHPPESFGLNSGHKVTGPHQGPELILMLHRAASALRVELPDLYLDESRDDLLVFANTRDKEKWRPSLVVGQGASRLDSAAQRAFVAGRKLAYLMPCMVLLAVLDKPEDLVDLLDAARLILLKKTLDPAHPAAFLAGALTESDVALLEKVVASRGGWPSLDELTRWQMQAAESACRVGLLLAGDIVEVSKMLVLEQPEENRALLRKLARFYMDTTFAEARSKLLGAT